ncbi:MAG: hypothetical protein RLZZ262_2318 [Bacteroidota bacterium]|jgi:uncharacterized RDD family membrane protein YckC
MSKSIEIQTTQNVFISYELSDAKDRVLAYFIDTVIKLGIYWIGSVIMQLFDAENENIQMAIFLPILTFYTLAFESLWQGKTIGKHLVGIKVIHVDGKKMTFIDYLIRWSFRIVDIYFSVGVIAILLISSTEKNQRIGDQLAQCAVVRFKKKPEMELRAILNIDSKQTYEPKYPLIARLKDDDVFLIRETIERYKRYGNKAHLDAMIELSNLLQARVECTETITDHVQFLRTLIKDYVVLTR